MLVGGLLLALDASAQVTTSEIRGSITDETGNGLPGANVIALHVPSGTNYGTSTRADGRFNIPNMRVGGPYTVTITSVGYQDEKFEGIQLKLGQKFDLIVTMRESIEELEGITVTAAGEIDSYRTGAETTIDNEQLTLMPTISRSASDIYRITPQAAGDSFGGRNDQFNNFSLDGSIFNNPFGLDAATPGGQTNAQPISLDAIDQIQVSVAPYDVTQSGFTGASVNAVTKSGTNQFHGTAFGFFRNNSMTGRRVAGEDVFTPELSQLQTGFSLGGPIVKDKLFFFANFELERRDDAGSNFRADRGQGGEQVSRVAAADLELVSQTLAGLGYQTGVYEGYIHETNNQKGILKLDWNINDNHTLTATYNFLDASRDLNAHPSAIGRRGPDLITLQYYNSGYEINNQIQSGIVELRSRFGNKYSNKLQVGYTYFNDFRNPFSTPFPVLNINKDGNRYIVAGHEPFSINNRLKQRVFQFTDNFDIYLANHTITAGISLERFSFDNSFNLGVYEPFGVNYPGGTFGPGFDSVADFVAYSSTPEMQTVIQHAQNTFDQNNADDSWALAQTNVGQFAIYGQDRWEVSPKFTFTVGLRFDIPLYFNTPELIQENIDRKGGLWDPANNSFGNYNPAIEYYNEAGDPVYFDHTELPKQTPLISPRLGINWDALGDKSLQVRGGTGLFAGRFPFVWIGNQVANPDFFFYNMTDKNFRFPQVWRTNLGIDKSFNKGLILTADFIYTRDANAMMVRNYGFKPASGSLNTTFDQRDRYDSNTDRAVDQFGGATNAYVFTNENQGNSFNMTFEAKKNWDNGMYASLAYNFNKSMDVSSIEAEITSDAFERNPTVNHVNTAVLANSVYGNRNRVVGTFNKKFIYGERWGTTISLFLEYVEGGRFSYTYAGDINNDGVGFNDLIYVPTSTEIDQMNFNPSVGSEQAQRDAFDEFIEQDKYLSSRRGDYAERNGALTSWYSNWDLRLLQDVVLVGSNKLQLSVDILNVGNLINSNWGVRQIAVNNQPISVSVDGAGVPTYGFDTQLTETFANTADLLSRWRMQIGLRFIF